MKKLLFLLAGVGLATVLNAQSPAIQVSRHGVGDPLVLLPGFATPASVWDETIRNIRGTYEYHQIIIVDAIPCMRALMLPGIDPQHIRYDSPQVVRMLQMSEDSMRYTAKLTAQNMTLRPERVDTLVQKQINQVLSDGE